MLGMLRHYRKLALSTVAGGVVFSSGGFAQEQLPVSDQPTNKDKPSSGGILVESLVRPKPGAVTLSLQECLEMAHSRQPTIIAAHHSLKATQIGVQSLLNLRPITERLSPDIPFRRQQAQRGIIVATAAVHKVEQETTYDVTYLYYSYVYAYQQELTAIDVLEQMDIYYKTAEEIVKSGGGGKKINQFTLYGLQMLLSDIVKLKEKAEFGRKRALEALKEAMSVEPGYEFTPRDTELPVMEGQITKEQVIEWALTRRPELIQAAAAVDVFRLEVCAQDQISFRQQVPTFAAGSDLHSKEFPQPIRNGDYKPGAITPEMPTSLVGRREDRVARATALAQQQDEVYRKAVQLIRLEAANSYLEYDAASRRLREAKRKFENSRRQTEDARAAAVARQDPELLVTNEGLAGKSQSEYVEAVFEHLKSLAKLQRVTAGGVFPNFAAGIPTSRTIQDLEEISPEPDRDNGSN